MGKRYSMVDGQLIVTDIPDKPKKKPVVQSQTDKFAKKFGKFKKK